MFKRCGAAMLLLLLGMPTLGVAAAFAQSPTLPIAIVPEGTRIVPRGQFSFPAPDAPDGTPPRCREVSGDAGYVQGWGWRSITKKRCSCMKRKAVPVTKDHTRQHDFGWSAFRWSYFKPEDRLCVVSQHFGPPPWPWLSLQNIGRVGWYRQPDACPEWMTVNEGTGRTVPDGLQTTAIR